MKKILYFLLISFIVLGISSCKKDETHTVDIVVNSYDNNTSPVEYDSSYDKTKVLKKFPDSNSTSKMRGYIYNIIDIRLYIHSGLEITDNSKELLQKKNFNEWLELKSNLIFINKIIEDKVVFDSWTIEFPEATEDEIKSLIEVLKQDVEVYSIQYRPAILPEHDNIDNKRKILRESFKTSFNDVKHWKNWTLFTTQKISYC